MDRRFILTCLFWLTGYLSCQATNTVGVELTLYPATHSFSCRYTLTARAPVGLAQLALNLDRHLTVAGVSGPHLRGFTSRPFYDSFQQDTLRRLALDFTGARSRQTVTVEYGGALPARFYTDSLLELTPYAGWLPTLPNREYELVQYCLRVHLPADYQVVSTRDPRRHRAGYYEFAGTAPNIEITALAARSFTLLTTPPGSGPRVRLYKANRPANQLDTLLLSQARRVISYQNQTIGGQDPIRNFTFLLPGTNRNAGGLLDNAAVITYSDFDVRKPGELLILAHEISHKWWGYGTWNSYDNWLNEGFASYCGLLYLQAAGDTASFRRGLVKSRVAAAGAPAIIGFDLRTSDYATLRRVEYHKATLVLHALRLRLGDPAFFRLLKATAAARLETTDAFLELVEKQAGRETREWLRGQLST